MSTSLWDESDSENELPAGWEEITDPDDEVLFHNYLTGQKQHQHPISGLRKKLPATLPRDWIRQIDESGQFTFVHLPTGHTSSLDPRLAFSVSTGRHARGRLIARQKFDKFSCVDEVLLGKDLRGQFIVVSAAACGLALCIASRLAAAGATVICASPFCPVDARPCVEYDRIADGMWWIQCDLSDLTNVVRFGEIYAQLGLPLHVCILAADVLPIWCKTETSNRLSFLRRYLPIDRIRILSPIVRIIRFWCHFLMNLIVQLLRALTRCYKSRFPTNRQRVCCTTPYGSLTSNGFEWCVQHNYLAQVLLVQTLFTCLIRKGSGQQFDSQAPRIVLLSEEVHRMHLSSLDTSADTISGQFTHIPIGMIAWLDQYRWSKLFQLLYLFELQRRLSIRHAHTPDCHGLVPILCACAQGSPLITQCSTRWYYATRAPIWVSVLLRLFWLIGVIFSQALEQIAASPVLCAIDDSLNSWKLTETDPRRLSRALRTVLYVHQCCPRSTLLTRYAPAQLLKASRALWDATETVLTPYVHNRSEWFEIVGRDI